MELIKFPLIIHVQYDSVPSPILEKGIVYREVDPRCADSWLVPCNITPRQRGVLEHCSDLLLFF